MDFAVVKEGSSSSSNETDEELKIEKSGKLENSIVDFPGPEKIKKKRFDTSHKDGPLKKLRNKKVAEDRERVKISMTKPDPVKNREKEQSLIRIGTKGVVQLFNAVSERQKALRTKVKMAKDAELRKRRALDEFQPQYFTKKLEDQPEFKNEDDDRKPGWDVFQDDYEGHEDDFGKVKEEQESSTSDSE